MSSQLTDSTSFYEFWAWLEQNKKRLIYVAVALVVVGSIIAVYRWNKAQTELAASDALLQLRPPLGSQDKTSVPEAASYLKVANSFPSTTAAQRALLLAAGALFNEGKYQEARGQFESFLQRYEAHPLAVTAAYGKAASLEAEGRQEEALRAYQDVVTRHSRAALLDDAKLALARLYEAAKQPQLALQMYEEITRTNLMSARSTEAMRRKDNLIARHPELAKTNTLAASPPLGVSSAPTNLPTPASTVMSSNPPAAQVNPTQPAATNIAVPPPAPATNGAVPKQ
ncbi:MAG: tetratricopeptide repeat protein [Verrucomicrobia bacterium]|nr:tetratricopeptide repeat protein [Verrucomicrobiota bacterium]